MTRSNLKYALSFINVLMLMLVFANLSNLCTINFLITS